MSLKVPKWQVNEELPPLQRFANPKTREALKERLISGDYRSLTETGEVNPALKDAIISIIGSRQIESLVEQDTGAEADDEGLLIPKRRAGVELLVSIATRLRNQNIYNFLAVVLSIIALSCGLPCTMWALLGSMGVLFSKAWTVRLVREIGDEIARREVKHSSKSIGFCVSDNKSYLESIEYVHAEGIPGLTEQPLRASGRFLHTVSNFQVTVIMPDGLDIIIEKGRTLITSTSLS